MKEVTHICVSAGQRLIAQGVVGVGPQVLLFDDFRQQHDVHTTPACTASNKDMSMLPQDRPLRSQQSLQTRSQLLM